MVTVNFDFYDFETTDKLARDYVGKVFKSFAKKYAS